MTAHSLATALIQFAASLADDVDRAIDQWNQAAPPIKTRLDDTGVIHFASVSTARSANGKAYIVIELSADIQADDALRLFAGLFGPEIFDLLTAAGVAKPVQLEPWLLAHSVRIGQSPFVTCGLLFDGVPEMSVRRIQGEAKLVETIEDSNWLQGDATPSQKLAQIREKLWTAGTFKPNFVPLRAPFIDPAPVIASRSARVRVAAIIAYRFLIWKLPALPVLFFLFALWPHHGFWLAQIVVPLLQAIIVLLLAAGALVTAVRWHERHDIPAYPSQSRTDAEAILSRENAGSQNILVTISAVKPGLARRLTLQLVFYFIRTVLPLFWSPGRLGDLNDIHFMRWLLLPGGKELVFRSHYDGSWVNYIEDFALRAPQGVSAIWSNTENFPPTHWLTGGGAADAPRFRQWVHTQTRPNFFNYSAYPGLSMERIRLHARIAQAIATGRIDAGVKSWMVSLGDANGGDF